MKIIAFMRLQKITLLLFFFLAGVLVQAQSFHRGMLMFSGGVDFAVYTVTTNDPLHDIRTSSDAKSRIYPFGVELAMSENLGFGAEFRSNVFYQPKDTSVMRHKDYCLFVNYHFLREERFNFFLGLKYGVTDLHYTDSRTKFFFDAQGGQFQFQGGFNFFLTRSLGLQLHGGFNHLHYPKGKIIDPVADKESRYKIYLNGGTAGISLLLKL